jgi:hypothetical protein
MATIAEQVSVRLNDEQKQWLDECQKRYPATPRGGLLIQVLYEWTLAQKRLDELQEMKAEMTALKAEVAELKRSK